MGLPTTSISPVPGQDTPAGGNRLPVSNQLKEKARADTKTVLMELASRLDGLTQAEADSRLKQ